MEFAAFELGGGWTIREILGLVFVGVLVTWVWIKFRRMQFPPEWEHDAQPPPPQKSEPLEPREPGPPPPAP
jgi:hypothetical protein